MEMLSLIENGIKYAIVEEFLFDKLHDKNSSLFTNCKIKKCAYDSLQGCLGWYRDHKKDLVNKSLMIKLQETNNKRYDKILKIYRDEDLDKYLALL